jgi:hypothetical protein
MAEFPRLNSNSKTDLLLLHHGTPSIVLLFPKLGTGETSTVLTIFHGQRTNTSLNIAVHAGLKDLLQLLLIDSTFFLTTRAQPQLVFPLKLWLTAKLVVLAMVEIHQVSMTMLTITVSQAPAVNNMLLLTLTLILAIPLTSAEIAHGLPLQPTRLA